MDRLRELRLKKNLTQKELADILDVDRTAIAKYETGASGAKSEVLKKIADYFGVSVDYLLERSDNSHSSDPDNPSSTGIWIPVLGKVAAGIPISAVTDILDHEEISREMADTGDDYFALSIKGDSMEPRMHEGDVVIVRQQPDVDSGEIAVVLVNGEDATVKRIKKSPEGLMLISLNPAYDPMFYSDEDIASLPVTIIGKVVELRAKF